MADKKTYNLKHLDRSQISMIRKLAKDDIAEVELTVSYKDISELAAKKPAKK